MADSLFQMQFVDVLYKPLLYKILVVLNFFLLIIDVLQRLIKRMAEGDRMTESFVMRLNEELLGWGVVAVSVFLLDELISLPDDTNQLLSFADLLLSIGACMLILVGIWAHILLLSTKKHYAALTVRRITARSLACSRASLSAAQPHVNAGAVTIRTLPRTAWCTCTSKQLQEELDFLVGAGNITLQLHAPLDFPFGVYCHEIVGQVIIDIININSISFLAFFAAVAVALGGTSVATQPAWKSTEAVIALSAAFGFGLLLFTLAIDLLLHHAKRTLRGLYGCDEKRTKILDAALQ
eukprot:CAMPEP_0183333526 /NCGR_PEP_ID=MMETSP0164_2-20130417/2418_1 /TAXON_ID=221442 /ORGANISM="Coccolithus pelagicus ssp braarudi, Strain PLY182g" /LENGTH=294 /DNA_ID=CAMNT_0025502479 /DNA_START=143 /DNA_END=1024 /DNA_ORIENTATION=-